MFGYSQKRHEVFTFPENLPQKVDSKIQIETKLLRLGEATTQQWMDLRKLLGRFAVLYLKWRYGSPETYILLAYVDKTLVHIEWIVPANKIRGRYPFVTKDSYSIISCLTSQSFRGLGIYPSQIQEVVKSNIPAKLFWIWATYSNVPSLRGIGKAGGVKIGEFIQEKWFWGCISHVEYCPEESAGK
jgi:hypothetical protein